MFEHIANKHTRRAYERWWSRFQTEAQGLTAPELANWLAKLVAEGLGKSSIMQARAAVINGAKALWMAGELDPNAYLILKEVDLPKAESGQRAGRWLNRGQMQDLMQQTQLGRTEQQKARNWLVLTLLAVMGLRREEVATLRWDDLLVDEDLLRLRVHGKGSKVGYIQVPELVHKALVRWQTFCPMQAGTAIIRRVWKSGKVDGQGLSPSGVYKVITDLAAAAELGRVSPHDLRRSVAELLRQAGVSEDEISRLLRHNDIATTRRYLEQRGAGAAIIAAELLDDPVQMALPLPV